MLLIPKSSRLNTRDKKVATCFSAMSYNNLRLVEAYKNKTTIRT